MFLLFLSRAQQCISWGFPVKEGIFLRTAVLTAKQSVGVLFSFLHQFSALYKQSRVVVMTLVLYEKKDK